MQLNAKPLRKNTAIKCLEGWIVDSQHVSGQNQLISQKKFSHLKDMDFPLLMAGKWWEP